jgi:hypothetical protein
MTDARCTRRLIASGEFVIVEQCSCGSVHVTIGAVTLRLAGSALPALATTLGDAARALVLRDAFAPSAAIDGAMS